MSEFFDKPVDELLQSGAGNQQKPPEPESKEEAIRQIILEDFKSMLSFQKPKHEMIYPTSIRPRWKN